MDNCLVSKLKGVVSDTSLNRFGYIKVTAKSVGDSPMFFVTIGGLKTLHVASDDTFNIYNVNAYGNIDSTLASNVREASASSPYNSAYRLAVSIPNDNNEHVYFIGSKYTNDITKIKYMSDSSVSKSIIRLDFNDLSYLTALSELALNGKSSGNINSVVLSTSLTSLRLLNTQGYISNVIGDLNQFIESHTLINRLDVPTTSVSLDFDTLEGGDALTYFDFHACPYAEGEVLTWAQKLFNAGKTSGSITVSGVNSGATINGSSNWGTGKTITFTNDGPTVS